MDILKFKKERFISEFITNLEKFEVDDRLDILHRILGEYNDRIADEVVDSLAEEWLRGDSKKRLN